MNVAHRRCDPKRRLCATLWMMGAHTESCGQGVNSVTASNLMNAAGAVVGGALLFGVEAEYFRSYGQAVLRFARSNNSTASEVI